MLLITELTEDVSYATEEVVDDKTGEKKKNLYIEGVFLQAAIKNRNGRIYPTEVLANEVGRYVKENVAKGRGYGELGHPAGPQINLDRVSHMVTSLRQDGNNFVGRARIAETPFGNIARGLMESGAKLGVSSRGLGTLKANSQGIMEVQGDFRLAAAADIVADPSAPDAWVNGIMEGASWVMDPSGHWQRVEAIVEQVRGLSRRQIEEQALGLFKRYMGSLVVEAGRPKDYHVLVGQTFNGASHLKVNKAFEKAGIGKDWDDDLNNAVNYYHDRAGHQKALDILAKHGWEVERKSDRSAEAYRPTRGRR